jgi:hypothetical protein
MSFSFARSRLPAVLLESHDEIVSEPDNNYIAAGHLVSQCLYPQVEYIVQIDVRQQRGDDSPNAKDNLVSALIR